MSVAVDTDVLGRVAARLRDARVGLPTIAQLADPSRIPPAIRGALAGVGPDEPDPLNLFRVHWYNAADRRGHVDVPLHVELPPEMTGVSARIVIALGDRFPMIGAHKVLAAYACLAPRIVTILRRSATESVVNCTLNKHISSVVCSPQCTRFGGELGLCGLSAELSYSAST